jgi:PAS domain S-box-containing protein
MDINNAPSTQQLKQQIRLEEIRLLYGGTPFSYTAATVIAFIIYAILTGHVSSENNLTLWLTIILGVMLIRSFDSYQFSKQDTESQQQGQWRTRFFVGTGAAGLCWGLLPWMGYTPNVEYTSFIIVCLIGVIAGSLSTLSYRWEAMMIFLLTASLLLVARLAYEGNIFSNATAIVLTVFIFFSLSAGKRIFNNTQQNIRLRLEADNRERMLEIMHQKQALHIQNTPLAIIEFDIDLQISEWNHAAEKIFGYSREEALNENILRLIVPRDSSSETEKIWERLLNYEAIIGTVVENKTRNGSLIFCQWFVTPLTGSKNNIIGMAAMALDITDKKHSEHIILKAKEEAEKANQAKSDFLSNMSHELRTPLNAILGFTQLLSFEKSLTDKQQSHVSEINNAGNLLLELVNQILDLAKIEKGHLQLSMEKVSLADVFKECHAMILPFATKHNISLYFDTGISGFVIADYTRLKQVMLNLLSNAIKYNSTNGSVTVRALQKQDNIIRLSVIDTGKGIADSLSRELFQPFNRLNATGNIEGTGIGLSISRELVEMMKGQIGVTSTIGIGSDFWVELTGKLDINNTLEIESNNSNAKPLAVIEKASNYAILVAEDNPTNQTLIRNQLESLGYSADIVKDGKEALVKLSEHDYQLLITDCNMPVMDGYQLTQKIRDRGNTKLPIIALTADVFPEKKEKCIKVGMNDQITKPVNLETLKSTIEKYLP